MNIKTVVPTWTRSKEQFFERDAFLALIDHYETIGWGFYGVDVFSADGQLLTVEIAPEHAVAWARSVAQQWTDDGVLFSPTLCPHQERPPAEHGASHHGGSPLRVDMVGSGEE
jgi:hypothetical protein